MRTIRDEDDDEEPVTINDVRCISATDKALLCIIDGKQRWIPQSQVTDDSEVFEFGGEGKLTITGWFARKEGLG